MFFKSLKGQIALALGACIIGTSVAAQDFPTRDIQLIVPWPAGGGADAISRKISNIAEQDLPKSIYVENIAGAVTATGLIQMTSSRPDGHTVGVLTYDSVITLPRGQMVPGYSLDNMIPIARITSETDAIVVSKQSGINTFEELIEAAKANPGTVRVGVAPKGSGPYLSVIQLEKLLDVDFNVITYAGSSSAEAEALLSGELDAAISSLGDFSGIISSGDEAVATLETAFKTAYDSAEFQDWLKQVGVTPDWLSSDQVRGWMDELQNKTFILMDELKL
mgnify:CR=1 FL=1